MKRLTSVLLFMAAVAGSVYGQGVSSFKVTTTVSGIPFFVDGVQYRSSQLFLWPAGSKHELTFKGNQEDGSFLDELLTTRYTFGGWSVDGGVSAGGTGSSITITADPTVTGYTGSVSVAYRVNVVIMDGAGNSPPCGAPGDLTDPLSRPGVVLCWWDVFLEQRNTLHASWPGFPFGVPVSRICVYWLDR